MVSLRLRRARDYTLPPEYGSSPHPNKVVVGQNATTENKEGMGHANTRELFQDGRIFLRANSWVTDLLRKIALLMETRQRHI